MVKSLLAKAQDSGLIPLSKEMGTHSNILAWEIPWTEEPRGLQLIGLQKSQHDLATKTTTKGKSMDKALLKCLQRIKVWHFYCSLRLQPLCSSYNIVLCHQAHWWLSIFLKGGWLLCFRFFFLGSTSIMQIIQHYWWLKYWWWFETLFIILTE